VQPLLVWCVEACCDSDAPLVICTVTAFTSHDASNVPQHVDSGDGTGFVEICDVQRWSKA
jgi:hypothetical protein